MHVCVFYFLAAINNYACVSTFFKKKGFFGNYELKTWHEHSNFGL